LAAVSCVALLLTAGGLASQASGERRPGEGTKAKPQLEGLLTLQQTLLLKTLIRLAKLDKKIDKSGQKLDTLVESAHTDWFAPFASLIDKNVAGFAGAQIVVFNPSRHKTHVWIRVFHMTSAGNSYQTCERDVAPGGVSAACLFYKTGGWAYVHGKGPVVPYGLTFTKSLSPAKPTPAPKPNDDEAIPLVHILIPAKLDWYPSCPQALIGVQLACQK
jgi:hypothetical protein